MVITLLMYTGKASGDNSEEQQSDRGMEDGGYEREDEEEKGFQPRLQPDEDIFVFKNIELAGVSRTQRIRKLLVSQTVKVIITEQNKFYCCRTNRDPQYRAFDVGDTGRENFLGLLSKDKQYVIRGVHLDPVGNHCILTCDNGTNFYFNQRDSKFKELKELKGVNIRAVGYHSSGTQTKSGDILLVGDGGIVWLYRVQLQANGDIRETIVLQIQIYLTTQQIVGMEILRFMQNNNKSYVVVVFATLSSIFCVAGPDDLEVLLAKYRGGEKVKQIPMPKGYQCLMHVSHSRTLKRPTNFLWTNGSHLLNFRLPDGDEVVNDNLLNKNQPLRFAKKANEEVTQYQMQQHPIAIGITDYHYYILFQESITILSTITQQVILSEDFKGGLVADMTYERTTGTFWIYSSKGVTKLETSREGTQAWKLLLQQKRYKQAYNVCKAKGQNVSYIAGLYADDLLATGKYARAASYFAETNRPFEEIFLKYLQAKKEEAEEGLQIYLKIWLTRLRPQQRSQRCLLIAWLIQLIIFRMNRLQREDNKVKMREKKAELQSLLENNLTVVSAELVYLVMQSHGRVSELVSFATKKGDFQTIVLHYLAQQAYQKALQHLKNVKDSRLAEVVCKYSHIFLRYEPQKTVKLLIKTVRSFKPLKLLTGLMNIPQLKRIQGIDLLKYSVEQLKEKQRSLHNILVFFYATAAKDKQAQLVQLMRKGKLDFGLDFGLRLFRAHHVIQAQIMVYGQMGLYGQAVALALEHNKEELAKEYADKPEYDDERKKLWIEIAKHYLVKRGKISEVIELTKQSRVVKIQDLLPFFNQNIRIENFKDQICDSLKTYSEEITRLKALLDSYSENTEELKHELRLVEKRCIEVDSSHNCEQCFKPLFSQQFYIFPCMHGFHRDCLRGAVQLQPAFDHSKLERIDALAAQIAMMDEALRKKKAEGSKGKDQFSLFSAIWGNKNQEQNAAVLQKEEQDLVYLKTKIDQELASECLYCGPSVVDSITMPFDNEILRESWKI